MGSGTCTALPSSSEEKRSEAFLYSERLGGLLRYDSRCAVDAPTQFLHLTAISIRGAWRDRHRRGFPTALHADQNDSALYEHEHNPADVQIGQWADLHDLPQSLELAHRRQDLENRWRDGPQIYHYFWRKYESRLVVGKLVTIGGELIEVASGFQHM